MRPAPHPDGVSRHLLQFMGICGAGKSTLVHRLAKRWRAGGGQVIGTIDWDPHLPDQARLTERAFRRDLDLALAADPANGDLHRQVVTHSLAVIDGWMQSAAGLVLVDRFVESYDHLPPAAVQQVEHALASSGFAVSNVLLVVGTRNQDQSEAILERLLHTRAHRPATWWDSGPATVAEWAAGEAMCQDAYRASCARSSFPTLVIDTTTRAWDEYEAQIARWLKLDQPET